MTTTAKVKFSNREIAVDDIGSDAWRNADPVSITSYWNGEEAPVGHHTDVRMLWSDTAFYVRFDCVQTEPLVLFDEFDLATKHIGLWEKDVCEIFIATDPGEPRRYYEFEVAPTGEWLDLIVDWRNEEPRDWEYLSGMETFAKVEDRMVTMVIKIPLKAFDRKPKADDVWIGNLFRQVGEGETRGYLTWSPTMTETPQFHVPEKFGKFEFVG